MADENEVVIAIAASLYASRETADAVRAQPDLDAIANEAWDLYFKMQRAVEKAKGETYQRVNPDGLRIGGAERLDDKGKQE